MPNIPIIVLIAVLLLTVILLTLRRRRPAAPPAPFSRPKTYEEALARYGVTPPPPRQHGKRKEE